MSNYKDSNELQVTSNSRDSNELQVTSNELKTNDSKNSSLVTVFKVTRHSSLVTDKGGIALLIVLWVIAALTVTVFSFALLTRTEAHSTLSFKGGMENKFLAEAGIERGIMELFYRKQNADAQVVMKDTEVWKADGTPCSDTLGGGSYTVSITGESGKIDINNIPDIILKNLLLNSGVKDGDADIIVDSVMDWKDPDDLVRLHGAESDYYMSLPNPYKAKNADFDALEELLLVRGVTPALLYGSGEEKGIIDFLSVDAKSGTINVNYAPKEVLAAVPGLDSVIADRIIQYREDKQIEGVQELLELLGENYAVASPYLGTLDTNTFTIEAVGYKGNEKAGYRIKATVILDGNNKYRYLSYKSPAYVREWKKEKS